LEINNSRGELMEEKNRVNLNLDHKEPGFFTDNVTISHNPYKFILDFTQITPRFDRLPSGMQQTMAIKHKTLIMDPIMAKSLLNILDENIKKYEKKFGEIKLGRKEKKEIKPTDYSEEATRYIG
jgi:hypothetical protein